MQLAVLLIISFITFFLNAAAFFHAIVLNFSESSLKTSGFAARPDKILKVFCSHQSAGLQVQLCATSKLALLPFSVVFLFFAQVKKH